MTKTLASTLACLAALALFSCGEDSSNDGNSVTTDPSDSEGMPGPTPGPQTPAAVTTIIIIEGPAGPPGPPGRDGVPAPGAPAGTGDPAPSVTTPAAGGGANPGGGGSNVGGNGGAGNADLTVLLDYDAEVPGVEAGGNTMFLDANMMPLMVVPGVGSEGATTYAEFLIPFDGTAPQQFGWNAELPGGPMDLSGMELVVRMRWVSGFNPDDAWGGLQIYAWSDDWSADITNGWTSLDPATKGTWVEYTLDLATPDADDADPMFNPAAVNAIGYTFNTGGEADAPPAATEALFQVDYVAVRPVTPMGTGGGGSGGTPVAGAAGMPSGGGGAGGAVAGAGGSGGTGGSAGAGAAGASGAAGLPTTDAGAP